MDWKRILPIYADSGWLQILKGTASSFSYLVDPSIILMLIFFAENKQSASRAILWGTAVSMVWGVLTTLILLFVTGPNIVAKLVTPVYSLTKFVSILDFVQNIDAVYIPLWLLGAFIKLSVCLFILSYGLSEWTGFKNWKLIACLTTACLFGYILFITEHIRFSNTLKSEFLNRVFYPLVYMVIPAILWIISGIRWRLKGSGAGG
jgi:spore germination protein KB